MDYSEKTLMAVTMKLGNSPPWTTIRALGLDDTVLVQINGAGAKNFLGELQTAETLQISFPSGSEPTWVGATDGLNDVADRLTSCLDGLAAKMPTQPFKPSPT